MILIRLGFKTEMLTLEECSADIYREGISYTQNGKHIVTIGMLSHKVLKSNDIEGLLCRVFLGKYTESD